MEFSLVATASSFPIRIEGDCRDGVVKPHEVAFLDAFIKLKISADPIPERRSKSRQNRRLRLPTDCCLY